MGENFKSINFNHDLSRFDSTPICWVYPCDSWGQELFTTVGPINVTCSVAESLAATHSPRTQGSMVNISK